MKLKIKLAPKNNQIEGKKRKEKKNKKSIATVPWRNHFEKWRVPKTTHIWSDPRGAQ